MRKRTAGVVAGLAAVLAALSGLVVLPALAGEQPASTDRPTAHWMKCAGGKPVRSGRFDEVLPPQAGFLNLGGTVTPCHQPGKGDDYAIVTFAGDRGTRGAAVIRGYLSNHPGNRIHTSLQIFPGIAAVCLSTRETGKYASSVRLDCVGIRYTAADDRAHRLPTVLGRIPVDAPVVRRGADLTFETIPTCPSCYQ